MPKPQQPELRRSGEGATDEDSAKSTVGVGTPGGGVLGDAPHGTPEANRPGHHPDREQDKPDADAFARRFGIPVEGDAATDGGGRGRGRGTRSRKPARASSAHGGGKARATARRGGADERTRAELVEAAKKAGITGYSRMKKDELARALSRA